MNKAVAVLEDKAVSAADSGGRKFENWFKKQLSNMGVVLLFDRMKNDLLVLLHFLRKRGPYGKEEQRLLAKGTG